MYWKGTDRDRTVEGQVISVDPHLGKARYNLLTRNLTHISLEQTSQLRLLLATNGVVVGDFIRVEFTGWRSLKSNPKRSYKCYRLDIVQRGSGILSKVFHDDLDHTLDGLGAEEGA